MEAEMRQKARDPVTKEEPLTVLSGESMVCRENDTSQDMKKKKKKDEDGTTALILRENETSSRWSNANFCKFKSTNNKRSGISMQEIV